MSIFKAYDIRGLYPQEINDKIVCKIGRAFVEFLDCKKVIIGRDCRIGSEKLFSALAKGVTDQGADVIDIGLCTTPELYFASLEADAMMITASHDPKEYNGIKLCKKGDMPIGMGSGLEKIKDLVEKNKWTKPKKKGRITQKNIITKYVKHARKFKNHLKALKVVVDAGNGMAGLTAPKVFKGLPIKVIPLFFELDGKFPNRDPNPKDPEQLKKLSKEVVKNKADLGMAFDGDADRIIFVDEKGKWIRPDFTGLLIAKKILEKKKRYAKIMYDLTSSWVVREEILKMGGIPIMSRVGHTYIKQIMREEEAEFAFEVSGHYYFKANHYSDSGIIAAMFLLSLLSEEKNKLSKLIEPFQAYYQSGEINIRVEDAYKKMKELEENYKSKAVKLYHIDGVTIEFKDWWFNIRPSHTEPLLRINIEAKTKKLLKEKEMELMKIISKAK